MEAKNICDLIGKEISVNDFMLLNNVSIADGIENIYDFAFYFHHCLTSIVIPDTVRCIGEHAFDNCPITSIVIPKSVKTIGSHAFNSCKNLSKVIIQGDVNCISEYAFAFCENLSEVIIQGDVKSIGKHAFFNCGKLSTIILPDSITAIEDGAFYECRRLSSIDIPKGMEKIGVRAFSRCGITLADIPEGVTDIEDWAFEDCQKLSSIRIPQSVHFISETAFDYCKGLKSIVVSPKNKVYDSRDNCNAIVRTRDNTLIFVCRNTTIPNGIKKIDYHACRHCKGMPSIWIPQSLNRISLQTFSFCDEIKAIMVDDKHKKFDSRNNCNAIIESKSNTLIMGCNTTIIPPSIEVIGKQAFSFCGKIVSILIPQSVTSIEKYAFSGCNSLSNIAIPGSVTTINEKTFFGCSCLKTVVIDEGVKTIVDFVFFRCSNLEAITLPNSIDSIGALFIAPRSTKVKIIIPKGSKEKFKALLPAYKRQFVEQ